MLEAVIQGILLGGYHAVLAAGLSLMFGVMRFITLAHGGMAVPGAMLALWLDRGRDAPLSMRRRRFMGDRVSQP